MGEARRAQGGEILDALDSDVSVRERKYDESE
jgi:hypothetical protein